MKKQNLLFLLALCLGFFSPYLMIAQSTYVKQIITGNSGKFEFTPPYLDFVTLQSYSPENGNSLPLHTVFTQSVQDICLLGHVAYIAAQDSIIKFNLNTNQRMAAVADSGLSKLFLVRGKLMVSKQYPITTFYAEVLDTADLSLVASVPGISGDCGNMVAAGDSLYLAVNGGWMGTEGKIAVIETNNWTLTREINFGPQAIGMLGVYHFNNKLFTVNKSPYSTPDLGSISTYNLDDHTIVNTVIHENVGIGAGVDGHLLYFGLDYGIGSFNMNTIQVEDTAVVADPGSSLFRYITSAAVDTLNNRLYINVGDYASPGTCLVYTLSGDSVTSYATGISTDAVTVDYRVAPVGIVLQERESMLLTIYPNPVTDQLSVKLAEKLPISELFIADLMGKTLLGQHGGDECRVMSVQVSNLPAGFYFIKVVSGESSFTGKFLKH